MDTVIKVENLGKIYKLYSKPQDRIKELFSPWHRSYHSDYRALHGVSFSVNKGETLGIIGCNGAGKSTLLKLITGVITPTEGTVETKGEISALLELGTGFNPEYSGYENIFLNGSMRGLSDAEISEKLDAIVSFADIGAYISQPVKTYSSGMFARLAFSVMVHFKPEILIVDEALSVGDVFFQQKCNAFMKDEMKDVTKLLVTHDMNSIANMADRVILLDKGEIVEIGNPLEVIENYLKRMHTNLFADSNMQQTKSTNAGADNPIFQNGMSLDQFVKSFPDEEKDAWIEIDTQDVGGAGEVVFTHAYFTINKKISDIVKPGDLIEVNARLKTVKRIEHLIIGYMFKDKYGNQIIGENSMGSNINVPELPQEGVYNLKFSFKWPEVKEGDYFLTIGLGEGTDQMIHKIQCWAHNIFHVEALALKPMHGILNNNILDLTLKQYIGGFK